ncbi:hypothetical protein BXZ70DRAFT_216473 [Cristinia sonorae]|uniref:Uncharacterized protein n=1 Tax=Cristinia sonorae TaxID=1940300 RepID=A0A8K0UP69_9AGAR|nr:hypothetical protein BXZ70DRAFT_216473 [Cristinia sonorae]
MDLMEIRETLLELNKHFAVAGFKFYFVKEPRDDLTGDRLVFASKDNVLIETLKAGTLGLPSVAGPIYVLQHSSGVALKILHPGVLILTKMKRWAATKDSDRPKTVTKTRSDKRDLDYLVFWLVQHEMTIEFELYLGKRKEELLAYVRTYRDCIPEGSELLEALQTAVKSDDWKLL